MSETKELLRENARAMYDEYVALMVLAHEVTSSAYEAFQETRRFIEEAPSRELRPFMNGLRREIRKCRKDLHIIATADELRSVLADLEASDYDVVYLTKDYLQTLLRLDRIEGFKGLPIHARLGLTLKRAPEATHPELMLLEAKLYEDMASLYNMCHVAFESGDAGSLGMFREVVFVKARDALLRATYVAAFEFVEAYLNGIAMDCLFSIPDLDEKTTSQLKDHPRFIQFREKALLYPRVYMRLAHPPLQETNCAELALLIESSKTRGALVHPSTIPQEAGAIPKEHAIFLTRLPEVRKVVDAAVAFVRRVEVTIGRKSVVLEWIVPRNEDGLFPPLAFQ